MVFKLMNRFKLFKSPMNKSKMGPTNRQFSESSSSLISQTLKLMPDKLANRIMRRRRSSASSIRQRKSTIQITTIASCSSKSTSDKQNLYNQSLGTDSELNDKEEPAFLYNPVDPSLSKGKKKSNKELDLSIMLLYEGLDNGSLVDQFERMPCEKPDEDIIVAKLPCNLLKNRYRDISPYDSTRVKIREGTDEDYINASHVNMEIPGTGIINRYIATQGPLSDTTQDFWQMVYEQKSTLIVMVTPLVENDFIKCHKYWPPLNDTLKLQDEMKLTCVKKTDSNIMVERKFNLVKNGKKRIITHLLYKKWPDHGVPDDSKHFHQLINTVRRYRSTMNDEPIIVHCSAGIGRTGVLILMETALCLIEQNLPVYPLELLKTMRDQRARLIQTTSQFTFVLQAIHDIYQKENQSKPDVEKR